MADSLTSPGLIKAANDALVAANPDINIARLFSYDMSDEFADWGTVCKVPVAQAGTISAFNMTDNDYETQDGTVTYATVNLSCQPKSTFEFKGMDLLEAPNAPYWRRVAEAAGEGIKGAISKQLGGMFTATACTGGKVVLSGDMTKAKLAKLRKECLGRVADTVVLLNPDLYAETLALFDSSVLGSTNAVVDGVAGKLFGFRAVAQALDLPSGVLGAIVPRDAVAFASRAVPVGDESCYSEYGTVTGEDGYTLTVLRHGSAAKGKGFINVTSLFGCALVQPSKIKYIAAS